VTDDNWCGVHCAVRSFAFLSVTSERDEVARQPAAIVAASPNLLAARPGSTTGRDLEARLSLVYGRFHMDPELAEEIISILDGANDMTIATNREDGYPQATTVSYVNDGLKIYFGCAAASQKAKNLARDGKVSLTVNLPYRSWKEIRGLSVGGRAELVTDPQEVDQVSQLMFEKFPQIACYAPAELEEIVLLRVTPEIVSVLDYRKGFGHTDLVNVAG
jgi:general stress protein 26